MDDSGGGGEGGESAGLGCLPFDAPQTRSGKGILRSPLHSA